MKRILVAMFATTLGVAFIAPAGAGMGHGPPYQKGPTHGDASTMVNVDAETGTVTIFQRNTRQAAAVHCVGDGPRGTLFVNHPVSDPVGQVTVEFAEAFMQEHVVIDVLVTGSQSGWLGHGVSHGPKMGEAGAITVPIQGGPPVPGETMRVLFGLQVHAGCLPHPTMLGLTGSRPVEGGRAMFPSVTVG